MVEKENLLGFLLGVDEYGEIPLSEDGFHVEDVSEDVLAEINKVCAKRRKEMESVQVFYARLKGGGKKE